ncbi:hypothetical protein FRC06_002037, partial [Ceratobasidium sp. 370]
MPDLPPSQAVLAEQHSSSHSRPGRKAIRKTYGRRPYKNEVQTTEMKPTPDQPGTPEVVTPPVETPAGGVRQTSRAADPVATQPVTQDSQPPKGARGSRQLRPKSKSSGKRPGEDQGAGAPLQNNSQNPPTTPVTPTLSIEVPTTSDGPADSSRLSRPFGRGYRGRGGRFGHPVRNNHSGGKGKAATYDQDVTRIVEDTDLDTWADNVSNDAIWSTNAGDTPSYDKYPGGVRVANAAPSNRLTPAVYTPPDRTPPPTPPSQLAPNQPPPIQPRIDDAPTSIRRVGLAHVLLGPGACVQHVFTDAESPWIMISNLPRGTRKHHIQALVAPFGETRYIRVYEPKSDTQYLPTARVLFDKHESAKSAVSTLQGQAVQSKRITVRLDTDASGARLDGGYVRGLNEAGPANPEADPQSSLIEHDPAAVLRSCAVKVTWYAPVASVYITYRDHRFAIDRVKELNGRSFGNRRVQMKTVFSERDNLARVGRENGGYVVRMDGLWANLDLEALGRFVRSQDLVVQPNYSSEAGLTKLRQDLSDIAPLESFKLLRTRREDKKYHALAQYTTPTAAAAAVKIFEGRRGEYLGNSPPLRDAEGQKAWDPYFLTEDWAAFSEHVAEETGVCVRADQRTCSLLLFGPDYARDDASALMWSELARLAQLKQVLDIPPPVFRRLNGGGLKILRDLVGKGNIYINIFRQSLTFYGDDEVVRRVKKALDVMYSEVGARLRRQSDCVVCLCQPEQSILLHCGHHYCRSCFSQYVASAAENRTLPIVCVGRDCNAHIPLSMITLHASQPDQDALFHAAFQSYVAAHPEQYRYCPTADCQYVYRVGQPDTSIQCRLCLMHICTHCHVEHHEGISCEDYLASHSESEIQKSFDRWRASNDVKSCPSCNANIEKIAGCNHMMCT